MCRTQQGKEGRTSEKEEAPGEVGAGVQGEGPGRTHIRPVDSGCHVSAGAQRRAEEDKAPSKNDWWEGGRGWG